MDIKWLTCPSPLGLSPLPEMLFTEQQHLCKAVSVARKQFHLSGTHAHSLHPKPFQCFFFF